MKKIARLTAERKSILRKWLVCLLVGLLGSLILSSGPALTGTSETITTVSLSPSWTTGLISDGVGPAKFVVADLNKDGKTEIATCIQGYIYALNYFSAGIYDPVWYSEFTACKKMTSADRNADGIAELYIVTEDGKVRIIDGQNYQTVGSFVLPSNLAANDIVVGDVDNDSTLEIVLARSDATLVYDANSFTLEWQAVGLGGYQVAVGNIDGDALPEIIVNYSPARILNAANKTQEWVYTGGFGASMGLGDVDGDTLAEIAWIEAWNRAYVLDGDTQAIKWQRNDLANLNAIAVSDVNKDGIGEVLIGDAQWGNVTGYKGADGSKLWAIPNPEHGVFEIGTGDTDNDGAVEVIWGAGLSSSGKEALFVGSWVSQSVEWSSADLDGPLYVAAGDVNNDAKGEIVMASYSTNSGYLGGTLSIYDGATHQIEWSTVISDSLFDVYQLAVGQLDNDPALEIVVGGDNWNSTRLQVYDGLTRAVEWTSASLGNGAPAALKLADVDSDGVDEIIVGTGDKTVFIFHGASSILQATFYVDSFITDLAIGDLDGVAPLEIAILTDKSVYVFEAVSRVMKHHQSFLFGLELAVMPAGSNSAGSLLVISDSDNTNLLLQAFDGASLALKRQQPLGNVTVEDLAVFDLDADGVQECVVVGYAGSSPSRPSLLQIGSLDNPFFWEYQLVGFWGTINSLAFFDVSNDGKKDLLFGSSNLIQVEEISTSSLTLYSNNLPLVSKAKPPRGLYGVVTENGYPAPGIPLDLRFYNGTSWSTVATVSTASNGSYSFTGMPNLAPGQYYYVRYQNTVNGGSSYRLWTWHTQMVDTFTPWTDFQIGNFDLSNIDLLAPADRNGVSVPAVFRWQARALSPTDSYEFNLFSLTGPTPYFYTDPPLGYTGQYILQGLPAGFATNNWYGWEIWVYSPDGGYGISYFYHMVYFMNASPTISEKAIPSHPKSLFDFSDLSRR